MGVTCTSGVWLPLGGERGSSGGDIFAASRLGRACGRYFCIEVGPGMQSMHMGVSFICAPRLDRRRALPSLTPPPPLLPACCFSSYQALSPFIDPVTKKKV